MQEVIPKVSFEKWYPKLAKQAISSKVINLDKNFIDFLMNGEFIIDPNDFPDLKRQVEEAIDELGGKVFAKLNFTAPTDALWIGKSRSLEITTFEELLYLFKASTRIFLDLTAPFGGELRDLKPVLVLKRWLRYYTDREYRVFLRNREIIHISSRYTNQRNQIPREEVEKQLMPLAIQVYEAIGSEQLIIDMYISPKMKPHVVDISPWNEATSTSMFTWEQIEALERSSTRLCETPIIEPTQDPAVPVEMMDGSTISDIINSMNDFKEEDNTYDDDELEQLFGHLYH